MSGKEKSTARMLERGWGHGEIRGKMAREGLSEDSHLSDLESATQLSRERAVKQREQGAKAEAQGRKGTGVEVPQTPMRQTEKGEDREELKRTTREKESNDQEQLEPPEPKEE